jgi:hypothetical protein
VLEAGIPVVSFDRYVEDAISRYHSFVWTT